MWAPISDAKSAKSFGDFVQHVYLPFYSKVEAYDRHDQRVWARTSFDVRVI